MTLRVGVVGLGMMGGAHFSAWRGIDGAEVTAICDIRPERLEGDWSGEAGNLDTGAEGVIAADRCYTDIRQMLDEGELDVVDICTPTDTHCELATAALQAGMDVFCEKPLARTASGARAVVAAANQAGRRLMVGHVLRFWSEYLHFQKVLTDRSLGELRWARFWRWGAWPGAPWFSEPQRSGGAALDLHIHDADAIHWLFGLPRAVRSAGIESSRGVSRIQTQYLYGPEQAVIFAEGGWSAGPVPFNMGAELEFQGGTLVYDLSKKPTLMLYPVAGQAEAVELAGANPYQEELRYFAECIRSDQAPDRMPASQAAESVALIEAEIRSLQTGQEVAIN